MKYNIFRNTIIFCITIFLCLSKSSCLAVSPWEIFSGVKDIGKKYGSLSVEKLSSKVEFSMEKLRRSLLFSPPEFIDTYISQAWKMLVNILNKYSSEIKEEDEEMYLFLLNLVSTKK